WRRHVIHARRWHVTIDVPIAIAAPRPRRLDLPHVEAVEGLDLARGAAPLAAAQAELDANLIPHAQPIELRAAVAGQLEQHDLRILRIVGKLDDELALREPLGHLLRLEDGVELAGGF